ncbi:MAG: type I methionyl aminopeptidase [Gemmatimonadaceae bacterium]|nr:type I methionyl aminopeptidase [Gemmatimonadaceae bacterium]
MIQLKSSREIDIMARGGAILAATVALLEREVRAGMSTADLDKIAEDFIRGHAGATPAFKGLYNFPASICTSINHEIVHGIPSRKRVLDQGDLVSIDIGVQLEGYYTDSATTVPVGKVSEESEKLLRVTREALHAGIQEAIPDNHLGDIGHAIQKIVEAAGFTVVRDLVGHGIGVNFHEDPQVPNYGKPKRGARLTPGLTIAIEPMVNIGSPETRTMPDRWTVVSIDGSRSAHFEHTVAVTESGPRILTLAA